MYLNDASLSFQFVIIYSIRCLLWNASKEQSKREIVLRFVWPYEGVQRVNEVDYDLDLLPYKMVHDVFHISILRQYSSVLAQEIPLLK